METQLGCRAEDTLATGILSTQDRLLLAAASPSSWKVEGIARALASGTFSWEDAFHCARRNRVASRVASVVEHDPDVDRQIVDRWHSVRVELMKRATKARSQLQSLGELFQRVGVRPLVYKGMDFHLRCHSDERPRAFRDLDVVVRTNEIDAAASALLEGGYRLDSGPPLDYYRRFHLHAVYRRGDGLPVELHWAL